MKLLLVVALPHHLHLPADRGRVATSAELGLAHSVYLEGLVGEAELGVELGGADLANLGIRFSFRKMDCLYAGLWRFRTTLSFPVEDHLVFLHGNFLDVFVEPVKFLFHQHVADDLLRHWLVRVGGLENSFVATGWSVREGLGEGRIANGTQLFHLLFLAHQ